jgi:UDP-2,3-diacylglucosamine pyrophosphatase LpxH
MAGKAKIIISDFHMGAGFAPDNLLEDFDTDGKFAEFLGGIATESDAKKMDVELIVNGDLFEFLQVPALDAFDPQVVYPSETYHPTSEEDSVKKIGLIIKGHSTFFTALRDFINPKHPRRNITIIKGNHDVNLYWGAVQDSIRQEVDATGDRQALLAFEECQVSREGIYVEHGNQYLEPFNRFDNFEEPLDLDCPGELETPSGSAFVMDFLNDVEREKWWVDSVKPVTALVGYIFAIDFAFAARMLVNLLKVLPSLIVESFAVEDEAGTGAQLDDLRQQLEDEAQVAVMSERYAADEAFRREFDATLRQVLGDIARPAGGVLWATAEAAQGAKTTEEETAAGLLDDVLRQVAETKLAEEGVEVAVFGHTHNPLCERLEGGMYLNAGTWVWWRDFAGMGLEAWKEFYANPENFTQPHYLTYVRVDYDKDGRPQAQLLEYTGQLAIKCPSPPKCKLLAWLLELWTELVGWVGSFSE